MIFGDVDLRVPSWSTTAGVVRRDARHDELIRKNLEWLETQNGITAEQRLDAYMLGDDSVFPDWATELPIAYRDRVVCGACGIT